MLIERQESLKLLADALATRPVDSIGDFGARLPPSLHPDAADVFANVAHVVADADIRAKDVKYKEMQEKHMRGLIDALRRGASRQELLRFDFLSPL